MRKALRLSGLLVVLMALLTLTACAPKDYDAAKEKLEKKDYAVSSKVESNVVSTALNFIGVADIEDVIIATKKVEGKDPEVVTAILFKDKEAANKAWDKVKEYVEDEDKDATVKKSGAWICYGTSKGVKDFA